MRIEIAEHAGVCYGVERALKLAAEAAGGGGPVHTLGPLIHNPQAVESLREQGVDVAETLDDVAEGTLVIRTHGVDPALVEAARARGLTVVDATCPFVSKAHKAARVLREEGYRVVIVGEADHPEVEGILAWAGSDAMVVEGPQDLGSDAVGRKVGVVVQTTQSLPRLAAVVEALLPRAAEVRVFNTVCGATTQRQQSAEDLASRVDVTVVVGGRNSGNTARLVEVCRAVNARVHHVETAGELRPEWFEGAEVVGVTAGASTPDEQIAGVISAIEAMGA